MNVRMILPCLALSLYASTPGQAIIPGHQHVFANEVSRPPNIRVLIIHDVPSANLEIQGGYTLSDPYHGNSVGRRLHGKQRVIEARPMGLRWGEEFPGLFQLKITPSGPDSTIFVDGIPYRGTVTFYDIGGTLSAVNELPVETYVAAQLGAQQSMLPPEAFAALAIAARSQAYYQSNHPKNPYWDVDAQASRYSGERDGEVAEAAIAAVNGTSYMVLTQGENVQNQPEIYPAQWAPTVNSSVKGLAVLSATEASLLAERGVNAAQILEKTFPGTSLQRMCERQ